ncbi:MAG: tetratricopeptide repeat protein [Desulfomonile tiedjei]|nr:tetratricopeptide repeat protein [Desulfomonile tiedjei]
MRRSSFVGLGFLLALFWFAQALGPVATIYAQKKEFPDTVEIKAPDGLSTKIYSTPSTKSEPVGIGLHGDVLETEAESGDFYAVRLPGKKGTGYVLKDHTVPWTAPERKGGSVVVIIIIGLAVLAAGGGVFFLLRARKTHEEEKAAAAIPAAIRRAEDLFRTGEYEEAMREFQLYLRLQGGEVRNPDVYRRLAVCYQKTGAVREASQCWEKMRELGGVRSIEDYTLGVELMVEQGRDGEAAEIYEDLLAEETDEDRKGEIRHKLCDLYRRVKRGDRLIKHAMALASQVEGGGILTSTVNFLISEGKIDDAIESGNKQLITAICREFLEDKVTTPDAGRLYLKCLEFDRTDLRLHRMLADVYRQTGDFRKAVAELTILSQLDKDHLTTYVEEAARLYLENGHVQEALAEGNPAIIKKIAQSYLARSEVHPEAVQVYERVLEIQPKAVGINKMLSTVYLTRGDLHGYMARLRVLHEIDGKNYDYLTDLAVCVVDNDLIEETIKEGNRELNAKVLKQLIKRGVSNDKAISLLEKLIKYEPENTVIRGALVKAYERRQEPDKVIDHLLYMAKSNPEDKGLISKAALLATEHNLLDQVLQSGTTQVLFTTAHELVRRKVSSPEARLVFQKILSVRPDDTVIRQYVQNLAPAPVPSRKTTQTIPPVTRSGKDAEARAKASGTQLRRTAAPEAPPAPQVRKPVPPPHETTGEKPTPRPARETGAGAEPSGRTSATGLKTSGRTSATGLKTSGRTSATGLKTSQTVQAPESETQAQFIAGPATTFVSGYNKGAAAYRPEELFLPAAGGLAYKPTEVLVTDGWGTVHVGMEVNTGRQVLVREFRRDFLDSSSLKEFVSQAGEVAFNLTHDNILGLDEVVMRLGSMPGFIHPYMPRTVEQLVQSTKRPNMSTILALIRKIMRGLAHAHAYKSLDGKFRKTYHFNFHPNQVLVNEDLRECKIMGLGYSQVYRTFTRASKPRWQEPGMNPATMPPEFFRTRVGTIQERAADIYSLGAVMYFMVAGDFPYEGPSFDDYKFGHTKMNAAPTQLANPSVPDWLDRIILRCLEKDPDKRWDAVADMLEAFDEGMENRQ